MKKIKVTQTAKIKVRVPNEEQLAMFHILLKGCLDALEAHFKRAHKNNSIEILVKTEIHNKKGIGNEQPEEVVTTEEK
jgi:hypothetical protein